MGKPVRGNALSSLDEPCLFGDIDSLVEGKCGNWNILVPWVKESKNDSRSSGERNGNSLNLVIFSGLPEISLQTNNNYGVAS